jgi:hypothetical protein
VVEFGLIEVGGVTAMAEFWAALWANLQDPSWWAGEVLSWIAFVLIIGFFANRLGQTLEARRYEKERKPYEGWKLNVIGYQDAAQSLYFEDVQRLKTSDFELLKFYKGIASGACQHNVRSINQVRGVWGFLDDAAKTITVDLEQIPASQIKSWNDGVGPANWNNSLTLQQPSV